MLRELWREVRRKVADTETALWPGGRNEQT